MLHLYAFINSSRSGVIWNPDFSRPGQAEGSNGVRNLCTRLEPGWKKSVLTLLALLTVIFNLTQYSSSWPELRLSLQQSLN